MLTLDSASVQSYSNQGKDRVYVMKESIQSYIDACNSNIEKYMHIEDKEERERALNTIYAMKAEFEKTLAELQQC